MNRILYHIVHSLWYVASLLPLRIHYVFSDWVLYVFIYKIAKYRVKVVRKNLTESFPEKDTSELRQIESRFYHCLCDYFVETIKMMTISPEEMQRRMVFTGIDVVNQCLAEGQSCALYLGHLFNWEWITSVCTWMSPEAKRGQLYHALENPIFDKILLEIRQRWGGECILIADVLRKIIEYHREGKPSALGYIADQVPHWNNIHHWCQFLSHDTPVMTGTERIATKNHQALFYMDVQLIKRGHYQVDLKLMTREPQQLKPFEATDIYFRMLEENIRRQPELWLWSHNRWKRTHEEFDRRFIVVNGKVMPKEPKE